MPGPVTRAAPPQTPPRSTARENAPPAAKAVGLKLNARVGGVEPAVGNRRVRLVVVGPDLEAVVDVISKGSAAAGEKDSEQDRLAPEASDCLSTW